MTEPYRSIMSTRAPRFYNGPLGTALEITAEQRKPVRPDQEATVACWFLEVPGAHPLWSRYILTVIHLRDIPDVPPAFKRFPEATHELVVCGLNPEKNPRSDDPATWQHLTPFNVSTQFTICGDAAAAYLGELCARACIDGHLIIEPSGIAGARESWDAVVTATAAHEHDVPLPNPPAEVVN